MNKKEFKCPICNKQYPEQDYLHYRGMCIECYGTKHDEMNSICKCCGAVFPKHELYLYNGMCAACTAKMFNEAAKKGVSEVDNTPKGSGDICKTVYKSENILTQEDAYKFLDLELGMTYIVAYIDTIYKGIGEEFGCTYELLSKAENDKIMKDYSEMVQDDRFKTSHLRENQGAMDKCKICGEKTPDSELAQYANKCYKCAQEGWVDFTECSCGKRVELGDYLIRGNKCKDCQDKERAKQQMNKTFGVGGLHMICEDVAKKWDFEIGSVAEPDRTDILESAMEGIRKSMENAGFDVQSMFYNFEDRGYTFSARRKDFK